jgi:hypothetical protein
MKNRSVGAELFRASGQTDRHDEAKTLFTIFRWRLKTTQPPKVLRNVVTENVNTILQPATSHRGWVGVYLYP